MKFPDLQYLLHLHVHLCHALNQCMNKERESSLKTENTDCFEERFVVNNTSCSYFLFEGHCANKGIALKTMLIHSTMHGKTVYHYNSELCSLFCSDHPISLS